jgi:hypothetical protein
MSPFDLPILPRNMPYYRGPNVKVNPFTLATDDGKHQRLLANSVLHSHSAGDGLFSWLINPVSLV